MTLAASPLSEVLLFYMLAVIAGGSAIAVVVSRNIVRMAVALMFTLVGVAGIFFLLNAEFLAAVQLVVYVGGTLILIVFGVMLTSSSPFAQFSATRAEIAAAITLAVVLLATVILAIPTAVRRAGSHREPSTVKPLPDDVARGQFDWRVPVAVRIGQRALAGGHDRGGLPGKGQEVVPADHLFAASRDTLRMIAVAVAGL